MKKLRTLKKWVSDYNLIKDLLEELEILLEFEKTGDVTKIELEKT